jgi:hypothetical protein
MSYVTACGVDGLKSMVYELMCLYDIWHRLSFSVYVASAYRIGLNRYMVCITAEWFSPAKPLDALCKTGAFWLIVGYFMAWMKILSDKMGDLITLLFIGTFIFMVMTACQ